MADCCCQRFGIFLRAHVETTELSPCGTLKIREVNHRRGGVARVQNPGVLYSAHDCEVLELRPKAITDVLSDSIAIGEKALGETFADDGDVRMVLMVRQLYVATTQEAHAASVEETQPDSNRSSHHVETSVRILGYG
jgi:hypothetical protein